MINSGWYFQLRGLRKSGIVFYNLVVLTSLIATAIRDFPGDASIPRLGEEVRPMQISGVMAKTDEAWRRRILYAATAVAGTRKLQVRPQPRGVSEEVEVANSSTNGKNDQNIISEACAGSHGLELQQDNTTHYMEGLPVYHVTLINTCLDCSIHDIHIACGDWASATAVNPLLFKRVAYNDCIVNDGKPISSQGVIFFEYTNSFPYPMHVRSSSPSC